MDERERDIREREGSDFQHLLDVIDGLRAEVATAWGEAGDNLRNGAAIIKQKESRLDAIEKALEPIETWYQSGCGVPNHIEKFADECLVSIPVGWLRNIIKSSCGCIGRCQGHNTEAVKGEK